ncbi:MAG: hypothetical protein WC119_01460 [Synergistaceae bacterium]
MEDTIQFLNKMDGLRELAEILLRENNIDECINVIREFWSKSNGAYVFMKSLFRNCREDQYRKIDWIYKEFMPDVYPPMQKRLDMARKQMIARFS